MKTISTLKLIAATVLVIFGLNTIVGFACSLGVNMGYNPPHNAVENASTLHSNVATHRHEKASHTHSHIHAFKNENKTANCCSDAVAGFSQPDQSVPQRNFLTGPLFSPACFSSFIITNDFSLSQISASENHFLRGFPPPLEDIRIAIRSFRI